MATPFSLQPALNNRPVGYLDSQARVIPDSFQAQAYQADDSGGSYPVYKGWARPGASTSTPVWKIQALTYDAGGNILTITWPQNAAGIATSDYIFQWSDRANYTYS